MIPTTWVLLPMAWCQNLFPRTGVIICFDGLVYHLFSRTGSSQSFSWANVNDFIHCLVWSIYFHSLSLITLSMDWRHWRHCPHASLLDWPGVSLCIPSACHSRHAIDGSTDEGLHLPRMHEGLHFPRMHRDLHLPRVSICLGCTRVSVFPGCTRVSIFLGCTRISICLVVS